jgi:hypothetical protein
VAAHARELAGRTLLLLDNHHNDVHAATVAALRQAGATRLTADVWRTDHSFSDRRVELARAVVHWLGAGCGYSR